MKLFTFGVLAVLGACGGGGGTSDGTEPDARLGAEIAYQPFVAKTRSVYKDTRFQLATTDLIGPIACGLATDAAAGTGTIGSEIILNFLDPNFQNCPVGTYAMRSDCKNIINGADNREVPEGCAYFRKYDQQGRLIGYAIATAGAVGVTGSEAACRFEVTLSFAGQTHHDVFTLTDYNFSWPWCK